MKKMKYVLIGGGFAGVWAVEGIRSVDKDGEIVLVSEEPNYSRPLITYVLGNQVDPALLTYRDESFFKKNKVSLKIGNKVEKLDLEGKKVILSSGEDIQYDKLLIATGGSPFVPPIQGVDTKGVFTFTTRQDGEKILDYINQNGVKHVIVLGGGLIGLKSTEALMELGIKVTVVELADRILSATFDKKASRIIENALRESGCRVITEDTISSINSSDGRVASITLKNNNETIECGMVIMAIGVRPRIDLVKDTPIKVNRGIVVDEHMETSVKDVYAAGDVVESNGSVIAILPVATRQGKIAGKNMAGLVVEYSGGIPMNSVSLAGIPTISAGLTDPKEDVEKYEILERYEPEKNVYKKLVVRDGVLVGAVFVSKIDRAGIYTGLIREKTDISKFKDKLLSDNFGLIALPKEYRKSLLKSPEVEI
ncbi:MAG: NAD(P)/FAD-dependent oxidoreductase [Promethearchaeota archaeon]